MNLRFFATFILASLLVLPATAASPKGAPDITLSTANGGPLHLSDLKGRVVLVDFWASWCIPCRKSFPELDTLDRQLQSKGLTVVAVNVDEQQKNAEAFLQKYPHTMKVAFDPKGAVAQAFDVQAMPSTMILDRAGRIRFTHQGYTEKTIEQYRAEILQLLSETE